MNFAVYFMIFSWYVRFLPCFTLIYRVLQRSPPSLVSNAAEQELPIERTFEFDGPSGHQMDPHVLPCHLFWEIQESEKKKVELDLPRSEDRAHGVTLRPSRAMGPILGLKPPFASFFTPPTCLDLKPIIQSLDTGKSQKRDCETETNLQRLEGGCWSSRPRLVDLLELERKRTRGWEIWRVQATPEIGENSCYGRRGGQGVIETMLDICELGAANAADLDCARDE
jgi:hypothetical protein